MVGARALQGFVLGARAREKSNDISLPACGSDRVRQISL
jgi:hypothetical protein